MFALSLSSSFPHLRPQIHQILPFLDIDFELKSKENTIQNLLKQPVFYLPFLRVLTTHDTIILETHIWISFLMDN